VAISSRQSKLPKDMREGKMPMYDSPRLANEQTNEGEAPRPRPASGTDALADLFGADAVLPEQIIAGYRNDSALSGENALMLAVLEDGIRCFQEHYRNPRCNPRLLSEEAEQWIRADDWDWPVSFNNVCETLGLNPEALRGALLRWKAEQVAAAGQDTTSAPRKVYRLHLRTKRAQAVR
jgi:hypothetical protein